MEQIKNGDRKNEFNFDIEEVANHIEKDYKPLNIELTSYEQEQEDNAIISYEELLNNKSNESVTYDDRFKDDASDLFVRKIDLDNHPENTEPVRQTTIKVDVMGYDKEEAFLKSLRKLQSNLIR